MSRIEENKEMIEGFTEDLKEMSVRDSAAYLQGMILATLLDVSVSLAAIADALEVRNET